MMRDREMSRMRTEVLLTTQPCSSHHSAQLPTVVTLAIHRASPAHGSKKIMLMGALHREHALAQR